MDNLDSKFSELLTPQNIQKVFENLVNSKTDMIPTEGEDDIKLYAGSDDVGHRMFLENINHHISIICEKGKSGKYLFAPFKERRIPKPPYVSEEEATKAGIEIGNEDKFIRVLSMSTIQDTIFQKLMANVLDGHADEKFSEYIDLHSFGYRKEKSSKMAVKKIRRLIDNGYYHVLDGDIKGFFDEINHLLLAERMNIFFGEENILLHRLLYRFLHVKRIPPKMMKLYRIDKSVANQRDKGIPQGGVLSGLLANVFLFNFDLYVVNCLMPKYGLKYFRYADDFVLMFKNKAHIYEVYELIRHRLQHNDKLYLHEIGNKTKLLDLSSQKNDRLDFLGFEISPNRLRIKNDNVRKFKNRIIQTLNELEIDTLDGKLTWDEAYFRTVIRRINNKIVGLEDLIEQKDGLCLKCHKLIPKRSWIGYFMMVTDTDQLRDIDKIIRVAICRDYKKRTGINLRKKTMTQYTMAVGEPLKLVVKTYYKYRKQIAKYGGKICKCDRYFDKEMGIIKVVEPSV
jgi:retron-type reverse transcriptase